MKLKIKKLNEKAVIPVYAHEGDSGVDLVSIENVTIEPGETKLVKTGIAIELPPNTEAQVRPRSGLALKHQITVLNTPGTIDEKYRGEICIILSNFGKNTFHVTEGMRVAQMVIAPVIRCEIEEVSELSETIRGTDGFGSTGTEVKPFSPEVTTSLLNDPIHKDVGNSKPARSIRMENVKTRDRNGLI